MLLWEKRAFFKGASLIIGVDEAGRGPLAGPVAAAAVMLKKSPLKKFTVPYYRQRVDDSKKMSPSQREKAFYEISQKSLFGIGLEDHSVIDKKNIQKATLLAMRKAVSSVIKQYCRLNNKKEPQIRKKICVLIDGTIDPGLPYKSITIIKGDSKSLSIAAASIIAKVTRDRIMEGYHKIYPMYGFSRHKGYGTRRHLEAIKMYGVCPIHRKTFAPMKKA